VGNGRRWASRLYKKGVDCLGRMLGALVARIDSAFHGLESQQVMENPDLVDRIVRIIDSGKTANTLARTNKTAWKSVQDQWARYLELCKFMNTLVDNTVANASDRQIDACRLGAGKYLMRLVDQTAMGYVVVRFDGATVTALRWLQQGTGERFSMHEYANVCVSILELPMFKSKVGSWVMGHGSWVLWVNDPPWVHDCDPLGCIGRGVL
jgi:hypothetical protein